MTIYEYGNPDADTVLIQLTGDHELSVLKNEVEEIRKRTSTDFRLIAAKVGDWNYELSPWKAPAAPLSACISTTCTVSPKIFFFP